MESRTQRAGGGSKVALRHSARPASHGRRLIVTDGHLDVARRRTRRETCKYINNKNTRQRRRTDERY